jgi:nitrogen fixation protein FixH
MLFVMLAAFGVIIAVNALMATYAIRTFSGTVVDNSYVASQHYNAWLAEARAQRGLGWTVDAARRPDGRLLITAHSPREPLSRASVTANATHPLGLLPSQRLSMVAVGDGRYVSTQPLPPGRWQLHIEVRQDGQDARYDDEVPM